MGEAGGFASREDEAPMGIARPVEFRREPDLAGSLDPGTDFGPLAGSEGFGELAARRDAVVETRLERGADARKRQTAFVPHRHAGRSRGSLSAMVCQLVVAVSGAVFSVLGPAIRRPWASKHANSGASLVVRSTRRRSVISKASPGEAGREATDSRVNSLEPEEATFHWLGPSATSVTSGFPTGVYSTGPACANITPDMSAAVPAMHANRFRTCAFPGGETLGKDGGRYRTRTCDLVRVKHAL